MKKSLLIGLVCVLMLGLVFAAQGDQNQIEIANRIQSQVQDGSYAVGNGSIQLRLMDQERVELQTHERNVSVSLNLTSYNESNQTKLGITLSNGRNAEIKIMPETASETAIARLRLRVCNESNNCSIELKEVGSGNKTRAAYEVRAKKQSRVFGLFKKRMQVSSQVDAETGEVINSKKPWWAFLASEE